MIAAQLNVYVALDTATPLLKKRIAMCQPHTIATRIAPPLAEYWRDHLVSLPHNKHGWPSTGFWEDAARRVNGIADGGTCVLSCDKVGIRQRWKGGTITAVNVNNLTIPIAPESYGTTVSDWGFDNLTLVIMSDGTMFLCLWLGTTELKSSYRSAGVGKKAKRSSATTQRAQKFNAASSGQERPKVIIFKGTGAKGSRVSKQMNLKFLFVLKHSVNQDPFPDVVPLDLTAVARQETFKAITEDE